VDVAIRIVWWSGDIRETSGLRRSELAGLPILCGLFTMTLRAPGLEFVCGGGAICDVGFDVIVLSSKAVAAIDTPDAIESGRFPKLQGK
jgi:hypothetical protein